MTGSVLVTGAAGFVGGHLLDRLLRDHTGANPVIGWYRPGTPAPQRADVEWEAIELLDRSAVVEAVMRTQPKAVYHLAGAANVAQSWKQPVETYQGNVLATHHLLNALVELPHRPRVLISCSGAIYQAQDRPLREDDPIAPASPYATSKLAQEMLARRLYQESGLPTLIARSFNHIGPGQEPAYVAAGVARQIARIEAGLQEPTLTVGNLEPRRDLTDVRDTVNAYRAMMTRAAPSVPYNVCSGRGLSIRELLHTLVSRAAVAVRIVQDPSLFRPNDTPLLVGDHTRLSADTGWQPEIPLARTVDALLDYWRQRIHTEAG